jgi:hypothetical protein
MFTENNNYFTRVKDNKSVTITEAQSVSNLCNQKSLYILSKLESYNVCQKTILMSSLANSTNNEEVVKIKCKKLDQFKVKEFLERLGSYAGLQAFLMEHIKLKNHLIHKVESTILHYSPMNDEIAELATQVINLERKVSNLNARAGYSKLDVIDFEDTLDKAVILEYLLSEAHASKIGSFIHKDSKLEKMRKELANLPTMEYEMFPDKRSAIVQIEPNYEDDVLEKLHAELSDKHRKFERKVNSFKGQRNDYSADIEAKERKNLHEFTLKSIEEIDELKSQISILRQTISKKKEDISNVQLGELETKRKEIFSYRILIPDQLITVYNELKDN